MHVHYICTHDHAVYMYSGVFKGRLNDRSPFGLTINFFLANHVFSERLPSQFNDVTDNISQKKDEYSI
jgi:hypothetical protein